MELGRRQIAAVFGTREQLRRRPGGVPRRWVASRQRLHDMMSRRPGSILRRHEDRREVGLYYWLLKLLIAQPLFSAWWRPWMEGEENVPDRGPVILCGNHIAEGETILIPTLLKRRIVFGAKMELFQLGGCKGRIFKWFLRSIGQLPLDRAGGQASADGIERFSQVLRNGGVLVMFPEGGRSPDGRLYKGRTGAARLALRENVPVIPLAVSDTKMTKNRIGIPRLRRPGIRIGKPMDFSAVRAAGNDRDTLRWVTDEIMNAVMELSGQAYVDVYSTAVKAAERRGQPISAPVVARPGAGRSGPDAN